MVSLALASACNGVPLGLQQVCSHIWACRQGVSEQWMILHTTEHMLGYIGTEKGHETLGLSFLFHHDSSFV